MPLLTSLLDRFFPPNTLIVNDQERDSTRYLSILMVFLAFVDVCSVIVTLALNGLSPSVIVLTIAIFMSLLTSYLMRGSRFWLGQRVGLFTITLLSIGLIYAHPTPPEMLIAIFPVFYISLYIQPRYTFAGSFIALSALLGIMPQINGRFSDIVLCFGLVFAACVVINVQTVLMRNTQDALTCRSHRLAESEARFRGAIEGSPDAFFLARPLRNSGKEIMDFEILTTNNRVTALFGVPADQLIGKNLRAIYPNIIYENLFKTALDVLDVRQTRIQEYESPTGRTFSVQMVPTQDGIAVTMTDISERKFAEGIRRDMERLGMELEKEREMGTLRGNLMGTISHEFRTPLAVILNNTEILERYYQRLTDKQREERIHAIKDHILQISTMLDNITQIIRGETNRLQFRPELADLEQYIAALFNQISEMLGRDHILKLTQEGELSGCYVDLTLLNQIVTNLLSNALKFSEAGTTVEMIVRGNPETFTIEVRDQGIGIPEADLANIYQPFYRASNISETRGTGLGMSIVRDCVDIQDGKLDIQSIEGKGTTVKVQLPRLAVPDEVTLPSTSGG